MATSGSYVFNPSFAELLDEAFERAGIDPSTISQRHIVSARMSANLILTEWAALDGDAIYKIAQGTDTILSGTNYFDPQVGTMDILDIVMDYNASGVDIALNRISRQEYLNLADKTETGQPKNFYVDQSNLNAPRVYLWPVPDTNIDVTYDAMRYNQTLGMLSETLDVHRPWLEAFTAALAVRLAEKYSLPRVALLEPRAAQAYRIARRAGSGFSRLKISGRGFGTSGRTLRR